MMIDMVAFFDAIRNEANHGGKINKDKANAYPALQARMHHTVYKFTEHIVLLFLCVFYKYIKHKATKYCLRFRDRSSNLLL